MRTRQEACSRQLRKRESFLGRTLLETWSQTSQPPELSENKCLLLKPWRLQYLVRWPKQLRQPPYPVSTGQRETLLSCLSAPGLPSYIFQYRQVSPDWMSIIPPSSPFLPRPTTLRVSPKAIWMESPKLFQHQLASVSGLSWLFSVLSTLGEPRKSGPKKKSVHGNKSTTCWPSYVLSCDQITLNLPHLVFSPGTLGLSAFTKSWREVLDTLFSDCPSGNKELWLYRAGY